MDMFLEKSPLETLYAIVKTILDKLISSGLIARGRCELFFEEKR